jgi:ankyrin repeat protein
MTDLIEAAKAGDRSRVQEILRESARTAGVRSQSGESALMAALYHGHHEMAGDIADAQIASGEPLDVFAAAALGREDQLSLALTDPAAVNAFAYDGWTPLHLAAFFGRLGATTQLLEAGASLAAVSRNSLANTPLHAAVAGGHVEVSLFLIARGADVDVVDAGRHTPLHIAAEAGYLPVVEALLARGADPHAVDVEDKTPLSRAAARNHTAVVDAINLNEGKG